MSQVAVNGTTTRSFAHDAAGNLTVDQRGTDTYTTTYNVRNRPSSVTRTGPARGPPPCGSSRAFDARRSSTGASHRARLSPYSATYAYNGLEQMVSRSTTAPGAPSGTVHYLYDLDGHLIAEGEKRRRSRQKGPVDLFELRTPRAQARGRATGATLREYIWLASNDNEPVDLPLALVTGVNTASPVLSMVHADHLGRPIRMTDASRATVWQASWKPFGEPQAISGTIENNLRFPGQYFLIETGLAYNWHRHYDPTTGRYTQPDPLRFVDGPTVYAYVGGSPFMKTDRTGTCAEDACAGETLAMLCMRFPGLCATVVQEAGREIWNACVWMANTIADAIGGNEPPDDDGCDEETKRSLDAAVDAAKKKVGQFHPAACTDGMTYSQLSARAAAWLELAVARARRDQICYGGGDNGHQTAQAAAWAHDGNCQNLMKGN